MHQDQIAAHIEFHAGEADYASERGFGTDRHYARWLKAVSAITGQEHESEFGSECDALYGDGATPEEAAGELTGDA